MQVPAHAQAHKNNPFSAVSIDKCWDPEQADTQRIMQFQRSLAGGKKANVTKIRGGI